CDAESPCPEDAPCCSQYGRCGVGENCLGTCDPRYSYNISACMPVPVCKDLKTSFTSTDQLLPVDYYYGDPSESDWIYSGTVLDYDNKSIIIAMPKDTSGTVVSSTRYVLYGKVGVTFKTSRLQGVVSAFILFSNVQDEIDFENIGADLYKFQANFYYQGVLNYTNQINMTTEESTFSNYHTISVDWTPDKLEWLLDGEVTRTLLREDTWNETTQTYHYPQTPSRVQISLWPGGSDLNEEGTIAWAGGAINWNSPDIQNYGYYYAILSDVSIECYDPPSSVKSTGSKSYKYN
ncbi:chitin transglycosylase UTR2, partial [Ascoidea rubescens DSM 1968]